MSLRLVKFARLSDGRLIRILSGAEPDDNDDQNDDTDKNDNGDDDGSDDGDDDSSSKQTVSAEEYEKIRQRMQAADRRASEYERKIREFEDKDKTELQRMAGQVETLTEENQKLREELQNSRRDNAFLTTNGVEWHNPKLALREIVWDNVTDSDGNVDQAALKREIQRVSKEMPYLVKKSDSNGNGNGSGSGKNGPSGHQPPPGGTGKKDADRAALEKKYPALRK